MTSSSLHPSSNSGVSAAAPLRPFRLPQSKLRPEPQTANGVQVTKLCNEDMDPEANEAIEQSLNGSNIILRFNEKLQTVKDGDGLLNGILGALDSDYSKFSICKKSWTKVQGKDRVYDDCMKEDNGGRIKKTFLQQMGRSWKDTREMLYDSYYKPTLTLEQNLNNRPEKIFREHWRWLIDYRNDPATKCKQNTLNQKKQLYMHTGDSKSLARATEEESQKQRRRVGRGEVWILKHKRRDGTYIHEDAQRIGERKKRTQNRNAPYKRRVIRSKEEEEEEEEKKEDGEGIRSDEGGDLRPLTFPAEDHAWSMEGPAYQDPPQGLRELDQRHPPPRSPRRSLLEMSSRRRVIRN
ncbi:hypothetical protein Ahy_A01g004215 isoform D [Arachis hypogaea]|uniref:Uncharacterized protein n=1 Tax=Arachis hypogaea TaxID=3818 RepID=A0A445EVL0_ARAHY|nr:hypothetical protein Ahy_A01g004215 isoform D [Arachis hypogaea]